MGLEEDAQATPDPFLQKALMLVVDGTDLQELRTMLEIDITLDEQHGEAEGKVFEAAGGFSPTIGIIGAVLGLIQVMKNLANIDEVGHGIAVSFVATVYGVGAANLLFLPAAAKIKAAIHLETQRKEMILEAVCGIIEGLNPKLIRSKLAGYAHSEPARQKSKAKAAIRPGADEKSDAGSRKGIDDMARKKKHPEHENHERWLVSYADFITLLFAFFVVMFATSQADKGKAQQLSDSITKALDGAKAVAVVSSVLGGTVDDKGQGNAMSRGPGGIVKELPKKLPPEEKKEPLAELTPSMKLLAETLAAEIRSGPYPGEHGAPRPGDFLHPGCIVSFRRRRDLRQRL